MQWRYPELQGLTVARVNPALIAEMNLPLAAQGVVVTNATGFAARAGFAPGDILLAVNGQAVQSPKDVADDARAATRLWVIDLLRQGQQMRLRFRY